ncbi:MAG: mercuric transporter MerT family protein [Planctomycetes bacterium]|nr:mercuric transporter MerT family protein [Planctomycetota bacterium]
MNKCPCCETTGKVVSALTVESLVAASRYEEYESREGFRFCPEPSCEVVYFKQGSRDEALVLTKWDLKVRVGVKERTSPRPVCYCFDHTIEEIQDEVARTGDSVILGDIREKCRQGLDRCEMANPKGSCCLGDVAKAIKDAKKEAGILSDDSKEPGHDCCGSGTDVSSLKDGSADVSSAHNRKAAGETPAVPSWTMAGSLLTAILASACCWLPLLSVALGFSAGGAGAVFERYRFPLLAISCIFLAAGFYFLYLRKGKCAEGSACAVPNRKTKTMSHVSFWAAAILIGAFALFPNYVGAFIGGDSADLPADVTEYASFVTLSIEGMTCEACASNISRLLANENGVVRVEIDYDKSIARIWYVGTDTPELIRAIESLGYGANHVD